MGSRHVVVRVDEDFFAGRRRPLPFCGARWRAVVFRPVFFFAGVDVAAFRGAAFPAVAVTVSSPPVAASALW
jgi:hypothetical protein